MIKSILTLKCPRCHEGDLFIHKNPFNLKNFDKMPEQCSCCGQLIQPEPGFYFGAMYVSYGIGVALFITLFVLTQLIFSIQGEIFLGFYTFLMLSLWTVIFRYSRTIYLYIFVRYDPKTKKLS